MSKNANDLDAVLAGMKAHERVKDALRRALRPRWQDHSPEEQAMLCEALKFMDSKSGGKLGLNEDLAERMGIKFSSLPPGEGSE